MSLTQDGGRLPAPVKKALGGSTTPRIVTLLARGKSPKAIEALASLMLPPEDAKCHPAIKKLHALLEYDDPTADDPGRVQVAAARALVEAVVRSGATLLNAARLIEVRDMGPDGIGGKQRPDVHVQVNRQGISIAAGDHRLTLTRGSDETAEGESVAARLAILEK